MAQSIVHVGSSGKIVTMDSIAHASEENAGDVIVCGSHGGRSAAEHAIHFKPLAVIFNDAGRGKENAGIAGLESLDNEGIMAATVGAMSARIGDGGDSYSSGIISAVNERSRKAGIKVGMPARKAALKMLVETEKG